MASIRLEEEARNDPRFKVLGKKLGTTRFDARARVEELWAHCTKKNTYYLHAEIIDALAEFEGFHALILSPEVNLAEQTEKGIRIRGTKGRIEWLAKARKNGGKGGRPKKTRRKPTGFENETKTEPKPNLLTPILTPAPALVISQNQEEEGSARRRAERPPLGGILLDLWQQHSGELRKVLQVGHDRLVLIRERLDENSDPAYWEAVIKKMAATPFLRGENKRGWKATFDFLIAPGNHTRIMEGQYDSPANAADIDYSRFAT